jgi:hypothetical protein
MQIHASEASHVKLTNPTLHHLHRIICAHLALSWMVYACTSPCHPKDGVCMHLSLPPEGWCMHAPLPATLHAGHHSPEIHSAELGGRRMSYCTIADVLHPHHPINIIFSSAAPTIYLCLLACCLHHKLSTNCGFPMLQRLQTFSTSAQTMLCCLYRSHRT